MGDIIKLKSVSNNAKLLIEYKALIADILGIKHSLDLMSKGKQEFEKLLSTLNPEQLANFHQILQNATIDAEIAELEKELEEELENPNNLPEGGGKKKTKKAAKKKPAKKKPAKKKPAKKKPSKKVRKIHKGPRGGRYYITKGRKVYI